MSARAAGKRIAPASGNRVRMEEFGDHISHRLSAASCPYLHHRRQDVYIRVGPTGSGANCFLAGKPIAAPRGIASGQNPMLRDSFVIAVFMLPWPKSLVSVTVGWRRCAQEVIISGAAITHDMSVHLLASPWLSLARRSSSRQNSKDSRQVLRRREVLRFAETDQWAAPAAVPALRLSLLLRCRHLRQPGPAARANPGQPRSPWPPMMSSLKRTPAAWTHSASATMSSTRRSRRGALGPGRQLQRAAHSAANAGAIRPARSPFRQS